MSLWDIFNIKQLKEENAKLQSCVQEYENLFTDEHKSAIDVKRLLDKLSIEKTEVEKSIIQLLEEKDRTTTELHDQIEQLNGQVEQLNSQIIQLDDEVLYQSVGLYKPLYDFANSDEYKVRLSVVRGKQKAMVKYKTAAICETEWTVNGSKREGNKLTNANIKQILRSFNTECDSCIEKAKFSNFESLKKRILKSYDDLNKLNASSMIALSMEYCQSKIEELHLSHEYSLKKQQEKEEARQIREIQREEARVAKEIEEKRRELLKEQSHYNNALNKIIEQLNANPNEERRAFLEEKKLELEGNLIDIDKAIKEVDYREANQRAGYIYIISNIGSFGENVFKIGMTRRLEPSDRIDELSGAAVPFRYDVHALIFSDDAPKLESALHKAFEKQKINMVNGRKEFFRITLDEIKEVVSKNHDKTVDYTRTPPAEQYRESLVIYKNIEN